MSIYLVTLTQKPIQHLTLSIAGIRVRQACKVRVLNCYGSNPIGGYNTTPREIERALTDLPAAMEQRRNLQIVARGVSMCGK